MLSGGERSRLQLARLMLSDANFLLLDEPTNNLEIPSAEVLEAALEELNGTVLVISHDRYFLDRIVDRCAALEGGRIVEVEGGYSDHLTRGRGDAGTRGRAVSGQMSSCSPKMMHQWLNPTGN